MEVVMTLEKTTKRCVRYKEEVPQGGTVMIGTLYVQKSVFPSEEVPEKVKVTVSALQ